MKEWIKSVGAGLVSGLLGGVLCLICLAITYNNSDVFGNVADWVSGIGSFIAIIFIYIQIRQSDKHQQENFYYNFQVAVGTRRIIENDGKDSHEVSSEEELVFWGTNDGHVAGSFKFVGFCRPRDFDLINQSHISGSIQDSSAEIQELDPLYLLGFRSREFERVDSGGVSEELTIPMRLVNNKFKENETVCVVYMDPMGKLYKNDLLPAVELTVR